MNGAPSTASMVLSVVIPRHLLSFPYQQKVRKCLEVSLSLSLSQDKQLICKEAILVDHPKVGDGPKRPVNCYKGQASH